MNLKLIIGLGNPDKNYGNTYHNVGFLFVDYLKKFGDRRSMIEMKNDTSIKSISLNISILKSSVYMNESGRFVAQALKKHNTKPDELLIVHDDSDLALGTFKLQFGRGAAGHHGIESVIGALRTKDFYRLRIGVRPIADQRGSKSRSTRTKAGEFVLKKISAADKTLLEKVFAEVAEKLK